MKYKYPRKIQVGGHNYQVVIKDIHTIIPCDREDCAISGLHTQDKLQLILATLCNDGKPRKLSVINAVLWHEITHAIDSIWCGSTLTEEEIDSISQGIFQVVHQLGFDVITELKEA